MVYYVRETESSNCFFTTHLREKKVIQEPQNPADIRQDLNDNEIDSSNFFMKNRQEFSQIKKVKRLFSIIGCAVILFFAFEIFSYLAISKICDDKAGSLNISNYSIYNMIRVFKLIDAHCVALIRLAFKLVIFFVE